MPTIRRPDGARSPLSAQSSQRAPLLDRSLRATVDKLVRAVAKADRGLAGLVRLQLGMTARRMPEVIAAVPRLLGDPDTTLADRRAVLELHNQLRAQGGDATKQWAVSLAAAMAQGEAAAVAALAGADTVRAHEVLDFLATRSPSLRVRAAAGAELAQQGGAAARASDGPARGRSRGRAQGPAAALAAPTRRAANKVQAGTVPEAQRKQILAALEQAGFPALLVAALKKQMVPDATGKAPLRVSVLMADGHTLVYTNALAAGGYGRFHVAWDVGEQRLVAIKGLRMENDALPDEATEAAAPSGKLKVNRTDPHELASELEVMRLVGSPLYTGKVLTRGDKVYLVVPLYEGDLATLAMEAASHSSKDIMFASARQLGAQLARCHAAGFVHRDVKLENVLFDDAGNFVLADYGMATALDPQTHRAAGAVGTVDYLAPEVFTQGTTSPASDIFALGLMSMAQIIGQHVFNDYDNFESASRSRVKFTEEHRRLPRRDGVIDFARLGEDGLAGKVAGLAALGAEAATFLVDGMLNPDARKRATASEVEAFFASRSRAGQVDRAAKKAIANVLASPKEVSTKALRAAITEVYATLFIAAPRNAAPR